MKAVLLLALLLASLLASLPAEAEPRCDPPCGYIVPILNLDIPEKPPCGGGFIIGASERPTDCISLMEEGESVSFDGTFQLYWEISEDATYPNDPARPIEIGFSGTASNPSFLSVAVEPSAFTLGTADLFDPRNMKTEGDPPQQKVWFWFERDVTVTFTRSGSPTAEEQARYEQRQGIADVFVKMKSGSSGETFKEAFGVEQFRFDLYAADDVAPGKDTPAPFLLVLLVYLGVAARQRMTR